jgi:hypothetical protein
MQKSRLALEETSLLSLSLLLAFGLSGKEETREPVFSLSYFPSLDTLRTTGRAGPVVRPAQK